MKARRRSSLGLLRVLAFLAFLLFLVAGPLSGRASGNLLTNGNFDTGVTGWQPSLTGGSFDASLVWGPTDDRSGSPSSGSGIVENVSSGGLEIGTYPLFADGCFAVAPSDEVRVRGYVSIPTGQSRTGYARFDTAWYSGPSCTGFIGYGSVASETSADGNWHLLQNALTPPASTQTFRVGLTVLKYEAGGSFSADFDDVDVRAPEPSAVATAATALAALAVCRRRSVSAPERC
jgi:hypothetical protein